MSPRPKSAYQGFLSVTPSLRHITDTKNPCVLVLTRYHVTEINYVDRGAAARAPLQFTVSTVGTSTYRSTVGYCVLCTNYSTTEK